MKIGINLLAFLPNVSGGIEFYVRNLIDALAQIDSTNEYFLFTNNDNHHTFNLNHSNFHLLRISVGARPQMARVLCEQLYLPILASRLQLDVLHSPSYTYPILARVPGVITICDMLYKIYPEIIEEPKLTFWRLFVPWSVKRCKKVLTISEFSKQDIIKHLYALPSKVVVTLLALDGRFGKKPKRSSEEEIVRVCAKYKILSPYILSVGGVGKHKNAVALIKAVRELHKRPATKNLTAVITGNDYGSKKEIELMSSALDVAKFICLPGYVSKEDLPALYSGALAYVHPSYFEGFGLPLLEAFVFGVPLVVSDRASLSEVSGNAALVVNPDNVDEITDSIYCIASDYEFRQELIRRGYERIKDFSWEHTARLTLEAYKSAVIQS